MSTIFKIILTSSITLSLLACKDDVDVIDRQNSENSQVTNNLTVKQAWENRLKSYALAENIPFDEAEKRLKIMDNANTVMPLLNDAMKSSISGIYFNNEKQDFNLTIRTNRVGNLTASDNILINSIKEKTGVPLNFINNSSHNSKQMDNYLDSLLEELSNNSINNINLMYSPQNDEILVSIYGDESKNEKYLEIKDNITKNTFGTKVVFNYLPFNNLPKVDAAIPSPYTGPVMGGALIQGNGSTSTCTSGFAAYLNNVKGILTAGHCARDSMQNYYSTSGKTYKLGSPTTNKSLYMDIQFYPVITNEPLSPTIYRSNQAIFGLPINKIANQNEYYLNDWVCHSGQTSSMKSSVSSDNNGESCGYIVGASRAFSSYGCNGWTPTQPCAGTTMIMVSGKGNNQLKSYPGDSGGPWYKVASDGTVTALGIHSASSSSTSGEIYTDAYFSPLYYANELGSLVIPTNP